MIDAGILKDGEPVELLDGRVVPKMTKKAPHRIATRLARKVLESALPKGWYVDSQEPVQLPELHVGAGNVPEPDAAVIRGDSEDYPVDHPTADVVALVVEVSDSTLRDDRGLKKQIYAHARIPEYWIVNLIDQQLEVYQRPTGSALKADYEVTRTYSLTESVSVRIGNKTVGPIPVHALFPKK
jgi:Uma2 family endonuclease